MSAELVRPIVQGWERGDFRPHTELVADDLVLTGFTGSGDDETLFVVLVVDDGRVRGMHWHPQRDGALEAPERFSG